MSNCCGDPADCMENCPKSIEFALLGHRILKEKEITLAQVMADVDGKIKERCNKEKPLS